MLERIQPITALVEEMLDQLPKSVFTSKTTTFLDLCMGGGQFVAAIERRLRKYGHSDANIAKRVYGVEDNEFLHDYAVNTYDLVGSYYVEKNYLEYEETMKFDVVIGNPPYQKSNDQSSFTNLWATFVHKAWNTSSRYVCMITPKTWANQVTKANESSMVFDLIKRHAAVVNIDECSKHFQNVGSSFTYYILDKEKNSSVSTLITTTGTTEIDWNAMDFIPNNIDETCINILRKLCSVGVFPYVTASGTVGDISEKRTKKHKFSVRYSMGTEKWSDTEHKYQNVKKLVFPNQTTKNYPIYAPSSAPANRGVFYEVSSKAEANRMLAYIKSAPIQFLIGQQRTHHGVLNTSVIKRIPEVDVSRTWTDEELYKHFKLTKKEIEYIENAVK